MSPSRMQFGVMAATIFGAVFTLFGTLMYCLWPSIFDNILNSKIVLTPGSASFDLWEVTPIPMYFEFYMFNWTNPEDLLDEDKNRSKPVLVELGPYVFREHRVKVIKEWNDNNSTITFLQNRTWFFEPEMSNGSLEDLITTVNVPAITAAFTMRNENIIYKLMLAAAIASFRTKVHTTKTVREFLFEGYSDPLLNLASILPAGVTPVQIPFDKFGWFYSRNGSATYDGVFNMFTGVSDIHKFGEIGQWNYANPTKYYQSPCGIINGSAGEFFPPYQNKDNISLFVSDVCRTLTLQYKEPTIFDGIDGYRYWGDQTMFDNLTTRPENWCYCPSGECAPSGAADISSCKFGAPAFISFPHFYHADPSYLEAVEGLSPNASIHQLYIDIEPKSGIPMQVSAALQINILLQPMGEYTFIKHVPKIYFPCLWFRQRAQIDDSVAPTVKMVSVLPTVGSIVFLIMLSTGLSMIAILAICLVTRMCRKDEDSVVLNATSSSSTATFHSPSAGMVATPSAKIKSMKSVLYAYIWKQKVIPSGNVISGDGIGTACLSVPDGKIHIIQAVAIPTVPSGSGNEYCYSIDLNGNGGTSIIQSQSPLITVPRNNEDMAPLSIDQELRTAAAEYM